MSDQTCPKCTGPRDAKALYCPFCGVVFSRYVAGPDPSLVGQAKTSENAPSPFAPSPFASSPFAPSPSPSAEAPSPFAPLPKPPAERPSAAAETLYGGPPPPTSVGGFNPYQAPTHGAYTSPYSLGGITSHPPASRLSRLFAQILNGFGLMFFMFIGLLPGMLVSTKSEAGFAVMIIGLVLALLYWVRINLVLLGQTGQSYGKKWMGIKILRTNGEQAAVSHLVVKRYLSMQLIGLIPYVGPLFGLIDALMIFSSEQRCLHDHFADTQVVTA